MERKVDILRTNYSAWRHAERFGLVAQVKTEVVFYFETLEQGGRLPDAAGKPIDVPAQPCPKCKGKLVVDCPECLGMGAVGSCSACSDSGRIHCPECGGSGVAREEKT